MSNAKHQEAPGALRKIGKWIYTFRGVLPFPLAAAVLVWGRPTELSFLIGFAIVLIGEAGRFWALTYIGPKSRAEGKRRADRLITEGPYSLTRNPLYVANLTIAAGVLVAANRWPLLAAVPLGVVYYSLVALAEEEFLKRAFPDQWEDFFRTVPRFIPRIGKIKSSGIRFSVWTCLTPEMSTMIVSELVLLVLGLKIFFPWYDVGGRFGMYL